MRRVILLIVKFNGQKVSGRARCRVSEKMQMRFVSQ